MLGRIRTSRVEYALLVLGLALVTVSVVLRLEGEVSSKAAIAEFRSHHKLQGSASALTPSESVIRTEATPIAVFRIERIHLEVPIFDGIDELTLNRGVGRIPGTAQVGEIGNLGIAGHRDSFFRGLRDVKIGDTIDLQRPMQTDEYVVSDIRIVRPEDIYVLDATATPTLTLVTCFPFSFVGHAPERYIVSASIQTGRTGATQVGDIGFIEQEH